MDVPLPILGDDLCEPCDLQWPGRHGSCDFASVVSVASMTDSDSARVVNMAPVTANTAMAAVTVACGALGDSLFAPYLTLQNYLLAVERRFAGVSPVES